MSLHLAHPFRFAGGRAATVAQGSDASQAQLLGAVLSTRLGERVLDSTYGISDPTFHGPPTADAVRAAVELHGPDVVIESVTSGPVSAKVVAVEVQFS